MFMVIQQHTLPLLLDGDDDIVTIGVQLSCLGVFVQKAMRCLLSLHDFVCDNFISEGCASLAPILRLDSMFV